MATAFRALIWVLTALVCFGVIYCAYHIESPFAVHYPVETVATWGSLVALILAIVLFLLMPSTPNGRKGLLVAIGLVGFTVWGSFHALQQTRFRYQRLDLITTVQSVPDENGATTRSEVGGPLFLPTTERDLPVAVLLPDASEYSFERNVFYAKALARRGVAALVYRRTPAGHTPTLTAPVNLELDGEDLLYMLDRLDKIPEIYMRRAGVVGFYQNEWLLPYMMQKSNRLNYGVLIAASGVTPAEHSIAVAGQELPSKGLSPENVETVKTLLRDLAENLRTGETGPKRADLILRWDAAAKQPWFAEAGLLQTPPQVSAETPESFAMSFDPVELWKEVRMPVYLLTGSNDSVSLPDTLRERFSQYLHGNEKISWNLEVVRDANHSMLVGADTYTRDASFPLGFFDSLANWIKTNTKVPEMNAPGVAPTAVPTPSTGATASPSSSSVK